MEEKLFEAAQNGDLQTIIELHDQGVNLHIENDWAVSLAAGNGHLPVVEYLHKNGANISARDDSALIWAAQNGHLPVVEYLHKHGANISAQDDCALKWAAENGHILVVEYLHKHGANISAQDDFALKWAAINGHILVVEYLHKHGANISAQDDFALKWAAINEHLHVITYLLSAGVDPKTLDSNFIEKYPHLVMYMNKKYLASLPADIQKLWKKYNIRVVTPLRNSLWRARVRLEQPPSELLQARDPSQPTRDELITNLKTAGRSFARYYWQNGIPLLFPNIKESLGSLPTDFIYP